MEPRRKKYFTDPTTSSTKIKLDDNGLPDTENEFANAIYRRRSVSTQPRVHPATRLAAVAMHSSKTIVAKQLELHVDSEIDENSQRLSTISKRLHLNSLASPRRNETWFRRPSNGSPRRGLDQTTSTRRILRPRYPRTPTPESTPLSQPKPTHRNLDKFPTQKSRDLFPPLSSPISSNSSPQTPAQTADSMLEAALLSSPRLSPMNLRKSTILKSKNLFSPLSASFTSPPNRSLENPVVEESNRPEPRTPRPRSKSGIRLTPAGRRTPRNKTPGSAKYREAGTPKSSRPGTPNRGTPKYLKESSYVCGVCTEVILEKKEMLKHQRLHGKTKTQDKTATPVKTILTRTPKSGKRNHGKYECDVCRKTFRFRSNFKSHRLLHEQPRMFQCRSCQKDLLVIAEGTGRLHVENLVKTGTGNSEIVCKDCCYGDNVPDAGGQKAAHGFMCDKCPRTFRLETNLKIHLKTHAIEKIRDILKGTTATLAAD